MGKRQRFLLLAPLLLLACVGKGDSDRTVEGPGESPVDDTAVCTTCLRAGGETADFGAGPSGTTSCSSVEAPLTPAVEQAFELAQLRAFLGSPRLVIAEPREVLAGQPELKGPIEIEFHVALGEFTYRTGERCESVWAPVQLTASVGDGLLNFSCKGVVFKEAGKLYASMYAKADLASVTGSYRPVVDAGRPHVGQVETTIKIFPDQLRGSVLPELIYFTSEEDAIRWLQGKPPAVPGRASLPDFDVIAQLDFPVDDCAEHELPLAPDTALELLGGRSPDQLRRDVVGRVETMTSIPAVWHDSATTQVRVALSEGPGGIVCASAENGPRDQPFTGPELVLTMPATATLRTEDGKIDMPLDKLSIAVGKEQHELRWARLGGVAPYRPSETLNGWIRYSFANGAVDAAGVVQSLIEVSPGAGMRGSECLAFPPGGEWDTGECRYRR